MRKIITVFFSSKSTINYSVLTCIGLICLFILLSSGKANVDSISIPSSDELDFLDVNIRQISFEANLAFEQKNFKEAAKKYIAILHHKPSDVSTLYSLASCYAHLKKPELAEKALRHALDDGLNDISVLLSDSVWVPIRNNKVFKPVLDYAAILEKERGESFFAECKVMIRGRLRQPDNYDSTKAYPLLILFHGYGANPESYMTIRDRMGATNFFVAAPQGPYPYKSIVVNSSSYSWFYHTKNKDLWNRTDPMVVNYILNVISEIKGYYRISGVYLFGHSQGGALAYMTGVNNPDLINGIICFGAQNPKEFLSKEGLRKASSKLPIFISHGWSDPQVNFEEAQQAKYLLKDYQFNVTFKPFQGGHGLDTNTLIEAKNWIEEIEEKNKI